MLMTILTKSKKNVAFSRLFRICNSRDYDNPNTLMTNPATMTCQL